VEEISIPCGYWDCGVECRLVMNVLSSLVCCVGRGLCDKPITRSEESYRVCVCVCLNVCTITFSIQTFYVLPTEYIYVSYGYQNKQRLLPFAMLIEWLVSTEMRSTHWLFK
jgi:hypothetical protein